MILAFFMPYRTSLKEGGAMVYDNARIAMHYLRSWFAFDLLTCIPFDLIFGAIAASLGFSPKAAGSLGAVLVLS